MGGRQTEDERLSVRIARRCIDQPLACCVPPSSNKNAKSRPLEPTHITAVVAAKCVVVFRVALTVTDQEPITGARGELGHHLRVKAGRVPAIDAAAAANKEWGAYASAQATLAQERTSESEKRDAVGGIVGRCQP